MKDYVKYKIWKLVHDDIKDFRNAWKLKKSYFDIWIGVFIFTSIMFLFTKENLYLLFLFLSLLILIGITIYFDYKSKEWFRWKINRLKEKEKNVMEKTIDSR